MANSKEDRYGITQFNGLDFDNWKFRIETLLEEHGVLECLYKDASFETDLVNKKEYLKNDAKAKSLLIQCVANSHLEYVREGTTAKQKWDKLIATFERKGVSSRLYLLKRLLTIKYNEEEPIENYLIRFDDLVRQLKSAGGKIEEDFLACLLLLSLPESYGIVVTAIETLSNNSITVDFVKGRRMDEYLKRMNSDHVKSAVDSSSAFSSMIKCHECNEPGHKHYQCP